MAQTEDWNAIQMVTITRPGVARMFDSFVCFGNVMQRDRCAISRAFHPASSA